MAIPRFNFKKEEEQRGSPYLAPWKGGHDTDLSWLFYVGAGLALGILLVILTQKRLGRRPARRNRDLAWKRLHDYCEGKNLLPDEERILIAVLRSIGSNTPDHAAISQNYFESVVADALTRRIGRMGAEKIRRKLFFGGKSRDQSPGIGGTHELTTGQKVRLHFAGVSGTYSCTVISNAKRGFVVTLPASGGHHVRPRKDDEVEGFIELGNGLSSFESRVVETFRGGVFACRIAHATNLHKLHSRRSARVNLQRRVVFGHFPAAQVDNDQITLEDLQGQLTACWEGVLRDLSVGGCALATPQRQNFEVGDFIQFNLKPLPDDPDHSLMGTIVHVSPIPQADGGGRMLHVQFLGLEEATEGTLTRAMHRLRGDDDVSSG